MLLKIFQEIPDHRRGQGKVYDLGHVLYFSVLAVMSGADSYRTIHSFMKKNLKKFKKNFKIAEWKREPSYSNIRNIIIGINTEDIEEAFRRYTEKLKKMTKYKNKKHKCINLDGKVLRQSFDHFNDKNALQIFSAFLTGEDLILAHEEIEEKTNEIPAAQKMIKELGLEGVIYTADAMHCQTETFKEIKKQKSDAIIQVKKNQPKLYENCKQISSNMKKLDNCQKILKKKV